MYLEEFRHTLHKGILQDFTDITLETVSKTLTQESLQQIFRNCLSVSPGVLPKITTEVLPSNPLA